MGHLARRRSELGESGRIALQFVLRTLVAYLDERLPGRGTSGIVDLRHTVG
jgi:hypothetical protein